MIMRRKLIKTLPLLAFSPLLMANSPAPAPTSAPYVDIKVTCSFDELKDDGYLYTFVIENTGDQYALTHNGLYQNDYHATGRFLPEVFRNEVIAPHQTKAFKYLSYSELEDIDQSTWMLTQYTIPAPEVSYSDVSVTDFADKLYHINFKQKGMGDHYYCAIVELEYEGETHYVSNYLFADNKSLQLEAEEDLDLTKLTIKNLSFYRSGYERNKSGQILTWIVYIVIGCFAFLFIAIPISLVIFFSIMAYKHRKNEEIVK